VLEEKTGRIGHGLEINGGKKVKQQSEWPKENEHLKQSEKKTEKNKNIKETKQKKENKIYCSVSDHRRIIIFFYAMSPM
jgi:uncharacterized protein (DUF2344 family)